MKELKRISAFFMAMLMMLTVFSAFSVVSAEGEAAGGTQPVWPAPGSIKLDKDAAAVGSETNLWEVTLGIQGKNFDGRGNFAFGIKEQIIFPEINYEKVENVRGMDIVICTTAKSDDEAKVLLDGFNLPYKK